MLRDEVIDLLRSMMKKFWHSVILFVVVLFLSCQPSQADSTRVPATLTGAKWNLSTDLRAPIGNIYFSGVWHPENGMNLRLADKEGRFVYVTVSQSELNAWAIRSNVDTVKLPVRFFAAQTLPKEQKQVEWVLKLRQHAWTVYCEGKPVGCFSSPHIDVAKFEVAAVDGKMDSRFQKTASFYFHDDFLIAEGEDNQLQSWEDLLGKWRIHTALEDAIAQKSSNRLDKRPLEAQRSTNFYSVKGKGEPGLLVAGHPFYDDYMIQTAMQLHVGTAGLAFYVVDEDDFYSFAITLPPERNRRAQAVLRRHQAGRTTVLQAVALDLFEKQWVQPKVLIHGDRIQAFVDGTRVFDVRESLGEGGQFGLYVNNETEVRFDDVEAKTVESLDLSTPALCKFYQIASHGSVYFQDSFWKWLFGNKDKGELFPDSAAEDRWVVFGDGSDPGQVVEGRFSPGSAPAGMGVICGYDPATLRGYRFSCEQSDAAQAVYRLEKIKLSGNKTIEEAVSEIKLPVLPVSSTIKPVTLRVDATNPKWLKCYANGDLILTHLLKEPLVGASGFWVAKNTTGRLKNAYCGPRPDPVFRDQREKNTIFTHDPFMRHWASPEGQWLADDNKLVWFKGDAFGDLSVTLPVVNGMELHLGVEEGKTDGDLILAVVDSYLELKDARDGRMLFRDQLAKLKIADKELITVHCEDRCIWGEAKEKVFLKARLTNALTGTRMRIKGFDTEQLALTHVRRGKVKDFLFMQAPHEWIRNGGRWQVINRFQCDPRWSHMNGESKDDLADLWAKYRFEGDFCLEMYAGMRHGWYDRVGDLNITIMNDKATPYRGYTVVCSGWDPNHSQKYTRFYRNGKELAVSEDYLTPRIRAGNTRKYRNPLISGGRDVHGAWYYIKLRRKGNKLEYYFDNSKIFTIEDPDPIESGSLGIWTFMNSMMVARVRISAQGIERQPITVSPVAPNDVLPERAPKDEKKAGSAVAGLLICNDNPVNSMSHDYWQADAEAGNPYLQFFTTKDDEPYFVLTNSLPGGRFGVKTELNPTEVDKTLGWLFYVKRTPDAKFNFHFQLGKKGDGKSFQPVASFFQQLTGTDYSLGDLHLAGTTEIPASSATGTDWHRQGQWTRVFIPAPNLAGTEFAQWAGLSWRVRGFGNFQPSYELAGLKGNIPGDAYAIKDFAPVLLGAPVLSSKDPKANAKLSIAGLGTFSDLKQLSEKLAKISKTGMNDCELIVEGSPALKHHLEWGELVKSAEPLVGWSAKHGNSIVVRNRGKLLAPGLRNVVVKVNGSAIPVSGCDEDGAYARLPFQKDEGYFKKELGVDVTYNWKTYKSKLSWGDNTNILPPVLAKLDGLTPFLLNFDSEMPESAFDVRKGRLEVENGDPLQGSYMMIRNMRYGERLRSYFRIPQSFAQYPILQFRYRADDMTQISARFKYGSIATINEPTVSGLPVRYAEPLVQDSKWHGWTGMVSDAIQADPYTERLFESGTIYLGSYGKKDQSGYHSVMNLDDIVIGPAVNDSKQMTFTPFYQSPRKPVKVKIAVLSGGNEFYNLSEEQVKSLQWTETGNGKAFTPQLSMSDGPGEIYIQGIDADGRRSQVTSVPFLLDRKPPTVTVKHEKTQQPGTNGIQAKVVLNLEHGAPLKIEDVSYWFRGRKIHPTRNLNWFRHRPESDQLELNWPYLLRHEIQQMKNGDKDSFVIKDIKDGAGNSTADVKVPVVMDFAKDKLPPAFLPVHYPETISPALDWTGKNSFSHQFRAERNTRLAIENPFGEEPYLRVFTHGGKGRLRYSASGSHYRQAGQLPYLVMRLRRPKIAKDDKADIVLQLKFTRKKTYDISLMKHGTGRNQLNLPKPIKFEAGKWQTVIIDLDKLVKEKGLSEKEAKRIYLAHVSIELKDCPEQPSLDISQFTFLMPCRPTDEIVADGYDQSGMGGMEWVYRNDDGKVLKRGKQKDMKIKLSDIGISATEPGWLDIYLVDRAGNKSYPLEIPVILKK